MHKPIPQSKDLISELVFTTSRSSGPGGQNVNKVNSKVTLKFDVAHSAVLNPEQKDLMIQKLSARITKEGFLTITAQDQRSQLQNKEEVISRLDKLLVKVFTPVKARKSTKPSKAANRKR